MKTLWSRFTTTRIYLTLPSCALNVFMTGKSVPLLTQLRENVSHGKSTPCKCFCDDGNEAMRIRADQHSTQQVPHHM